MEVSYLRCFRQRYSGHISTNMARISMTYINAALDLIIVALFGWLLLEATNWVAHWMHERELRRQRKAEVDAMVEFWRHSDSEFACRQRRIRGDK
jgi:hypothetical protein